jgi:hypothetical protein
MYRKSVVRLGNVHGGSSSTHAMKDSLASLPFPSYTALRPDRALMHATPICGPERSTNDGLFSIDVRDEGARQQG